MQQASDRGGAGLVYFIFDLLDLDGEDLAALPLLDRKTRLAALLEKPPDGIAFSAHETSDGEAFRRAACRHGLEGVVSKRVDRRYLPDDRSAWIKSKCLNRGEFVIAGWSDPEGSRPFLGSLLLAFHDDDGRLLYAGRVGTGMSQKTLASSTAASRHSPSRKCRSTFRRRAKPASAAGSSSRRYVGSARSWSPRSPI
jgi:bifunctional non-homologous end joining protein LigD